MENLTVDSLDKKPLMTFFPLIYEQLFALALRKKTRVCVKIGGIKDE